MNSTTLNPDTQRSTHWQRSVPLRLFAASLALMACKDPKPADADSPPVAPGEDSVTLREPFSGSEPPAEPAAKTTSSESVRKFEQAHPDKLPEGWSAPVGQWQVETIESAPSGTHVLVQKASNSSPVFNVALVDGSSHTDVDIRVRLRARQGRIDQGGGVVWRAKDARNYYIARYNPLEDNYRVYTVKNGRRRQLQSADVRLDHDAWHTLRVTMTGEHIQCFLDGEKYLDVRDDTFTEAGMVGLWTKADAVTEFDDLAFSAAP